MEIENYLISKGIYPNLKGFDYIVESIKLIREDRDYKFFITKKLYPELSKRFNDTTSKVERAIRHAIDRAGLNYTNSEFLTIAELETKQKK